MGGERDEWGFTDGGPWRGDAKKVKNMQHWMRGDARELGGSLENLSTTCRATFQHSWAGECLSGLMGLLREVGRQMKGWGWREG